MEPNWGLYNNYYGGERPPPVSPHGSRDDSSSHRRSVQGSFLPPPPPPPPGQSSGISLPPVSASYSSSYHSSPSNNVMAQGSSSQPPMHMGQGMPYSSHMPPVSQPIAAYHYPLQSSPATMSALPPSSRGQPHGYSPRIPGGYPAQSPGMTTLSPLSPSTHVTYPSSSGPPTSSGSFPPSIPPPHSKVDLPGEKKRRTTSTSSSSWDGTDMSRRKDDDDSEQPWGMPQEQYKALNPRDKKQVRNRIGARRFRAKRKDYVSSLEQQKKEAEATIMRLRSDLDSSRREINDLRARLNMPPLPPPVEPAGLGLVVSSQEQYDDRHD